MQTIMPIERKSPTLDKSVTIKAFSHPTLPAVYIADSSDRRAARVDEIVATSVLEDVKNPHAEREVARRMLQLMATHNTEYFDKITEEDRFLSHSLIKKSSLCLHLLIGGAYYDALMHAGQDEILAEMKLKMMLGPQTVEADDLPDIRAEIQAKKERAKMLLLRLIGKGLIKRGVIR